MLVCVKNIAGYICHPKASYQRHRADVDKACQELREIRDLSIRNKEIVEAKSKALTNVVVIKDSIIHANRVYDRHGEKDAREDQAALDVELEKRANYFGFSCEKESKEDVDSRSANIDLAVVEDAISVLKNLIEGRSVAHVFRMAILPIVQAVETELIKDTPDVLEHYKALVREVTDFDSRCYYSYRIGQ